jgi:hypothetical protein
LLRQNLLRPLPAARLAALVEDATLDHYARRVVFVGLGYLPSAEIPSQIAQVLHRALIPTPAGADSKEEAMRAGFRLVALATMARLGLLASDADAIRQHLGMRLEGETWRFNSHPRLSSFPVVVGILYAKDPRAFVHVVAEMLRESDWTTVAQLAPLLRDSPRPAPELIIAAILERVRRAGPEMGEPDLIPLLADLAPGRIALESWGGMFSWPPQVREALADALTRSPMPASDDLRPRVNLLLLLTGDGQYGVRRAAFRAMARISPEELSYICAAWAQLTEANAQPGQRPYAIDIRRRAAEGAAWLAPFPTDGPIGDLACDPEPGVRETFARCRRERQERDWANEYLRYVLAACDNASLLKAWKYGRALERVGDDESLLRLEDRRREEELPPGIRYWLGLVIKKIRSRWDEVTRNWPEPWFARRGRLELVEAFVGDDEAKAKRVSCWLWMVPAADLAGIGAWGGWCAEATLPNRKQAMRVAGRRPATIIVTKAHFGSAAEGPAYFMGSGPYPEPIEGGE